MRRQKLIVGLTTQLPSDQARASKRAQIRDALIADEDVTLLEGVSSLALVDTNPTDEPLRDLIVRMLHTNLPRVIRGQVDDVATDIAWAAENAGWARKPEAS